MQGPLYTTENEASSDIVLFKGREDPRVTLAPCQGTESVKAAAPTRWIEILLPIPTVSENRKYRGNDVIVGPQRG